MPRVRREFRSPDGNANIWVADPEGDYDVAGVLPAGMVRPEVLAETVFGLRALVYWLNRNGLIDPVAIAIVEAVLGPIWKGTLAEAAERLDREGEEGAEQVAVNIRQMMARYGLIGWDSV